MDGATAVLGPTRQFIGLPRLAAPQFPTDELTVDNPPVVPASPGGFAAVLPLLTVVATAGIGAFIWNVGGPSNHNSMTFALPVLMFVSAMGMLANSAGLRAAKELDDKRRRYLEYLDELAICVNESIELQQHSLMWAHPQPAGLWTLAGSRRMWERRPEHSDFLRVRAGIGTQASCRSIVVPPRSLAEEYDPVAVDQLERFTRTYASIEAPIALALNESKVVRVDGEPDECRAFLRALLCQVACFHSPNEIAIAAVVDGAVRDCWDWLKWLPHNTISEASGLPDSSLVYADLEEASRALRQGSSRGGYARLVIVIDDPYGTNDQAGLSDLSPDVICLVVGRGDCEVSAQRSVYRLDKGELSLQSDSALWQVTADTLDLYSAKAFARRLARYRSGPSHTDGVQEWCTALAVADIAAIGKEQFWTVRDDADAAFAIPLGLTESGELIHLDLKEAAHGGVGPHGVCVGATGSGKSELLRTVVLGLAAKHSPRDLNFVLVDFKGGATFFGVEQLRHVSALITNLADEEQLVDRMKDALAGEMHRRQQLFREAGAANIADYQRLQRLVASPACRRPSAPRLLIIVDEFAELLQRNPEFIDLFTAICRVGRSLGMHLLLASQRLDEGRLRAVEPYLSYRICLKTITGSESRAVLGVPDAADLPPSPGAAILRTGDGVLTRFQTICVSVEDPTHVPIDKVAQGVAADGLKTVRRYRWAAGKTPVKPASLTQQRPSTQQRSVFETVVDQLAEQGPYAHRIWLPPLESSPALADIQNESIPDLSAAIGVIDLPFHQRRDPLVVDVSGSGGNVAIVGAPQTGKSTAVRTLITALAQRHDARHVQFYCLDFGGGSLASLREVAQVGSVAGRGDHEVVRRTIGEITELLRWRLAHFAERQIGSIAEYRLRAGEQSDRYGDVFLVVDGWTAFRDEFSEFEADLTAVAAQGLSVGIHLVLTATRWPDIRAGLKDLLGTRIELRLGDPLDSEMDRRQAALVPVSAPGRGITREGHHFALARPGKVLVGPGLPAAPRVRLLPKCIDLNDIPSIGDLKNCRVVLGVGERDLAPVVLDFSRQQHLLITGDADCGKTSTLRTLCRSIVSNFSASEALLAVVDFRRSLLGAVKEVQAGYAFSAAVCAELIPNWVGQLEARLPSQLTSLEQLRDRSWWTGPEIFVVVDDHDLVSASPGDPLGQLLTVLPYAKDIGLHLIVARRSAGGTRAMYDPLLAALQESSCMELMMSGNPGEGLLVGQARPTRLPPGRGLLITRSDRQLVQVGWCEP